MADWKRHDEIVQRARPAECDVSTGFADKCLCSRCRDYREWFHAEAMPRPASAGRPSSASIVTEQTPPQHNAYTAVWDLVIADMKERDAEGQRKYGTPLQPFNGRKALVDAYQELLDLIVYLRMEIYERDDLRKMNRRELLEEILGDEEYTVESKVLDLAAREGVSFEAWLRRTSTGNARKLDGA